jgi:hypothetical protein
MVNDISIDKWLPIGISHLRFYQPNGYMHDDIYIQLEHLFRIIHISTNSSNLAVNEVVNHIVDHQGSTSGTQAAEL